MSENAFFPLLTLSQESINFCTTFRNQVTADDYLNNSFEYYQKKIGSLYQYSRFESQDIEQYDVEFSMANGLGFGAWSKFESEKRVGVYINFGTVLALHDIVLSALCLNSTFNPLQGSSLEAMRWQGSQMLSPPAVFEPALRYHDYTPSRTPNAELQAVFRQLSQEPTNFDLQTSWVGSLVRKVPIDAERLALCETMVDMALCYIFLHEESHFIQGHLQFLKNDASDLSELQKQNLLKCFEYQADQSACQGMVDIFCRPGNDYMTELPDYAATDWSWWMRCLLSAVGYVFFLMDIDKKAKGETYYPPPRTRLFGAFKAMQAVLFGKKIYQSLHWSPEFGGNDLRGFAERNKRAMFGSLVDLTEFQISNADVANIGADPLWPLSSVFPDMACGPLTYSQYHLQDYDYVRRSMEADDRKIAEHCERVFGVPAREAMSMRDMAFNWLDDLDDLIEESNGYRDLTKPYRRWEVPDTISKPALWAEEY